MSNKKGSKSGGLTSITGGRGKSGGDGNNNPPQSSGPTTPAKVVDLGSVRAQRNQENRRSVERFFLHRMIDAVCETPSDGHLKIEIIEVSETGCSFRLPADQTKLLPRDAKGGIAPIRARMYFSSDSYLLVGLQVINSTPDIGGGGSGVRFGCQLDESFASTEAYRQFVRFMRAFAQGCSRDSKHASSY